MDDLRIEVIDWDVAKILAAKSPAEKAAMVDSANRTARMLIAAGIRRRHPDWTEEKITQEVTLA